MLPELIEASGLTCSRRSDDLLWTHNDSGGQPVLYGLATNGEFRGAVHVAGVKNFDWEDIASFELDGRAYILIGDVGDNDGKRKSVILYVIEEPDPGELTPDKMIEAKVAWSVPLRYPDSPHDCEATAVDATHGLIYLLTKRTTPPLLFTVPLRPQTPDGKPITAQLIGKFIYAPPPTSEQRTLPLPSGRFRARPTGMSFAPNGSAATVLTYGEVLFFRRRGAEAWSDTLLRPPEVLPPHGMLQAEGIGFSRDSRFIFVTGEQKQPPLLRYDPLPQH